jgi:hypothetical protein
VSGTASAPHFFDEAPPPADVAEPVDVRPPPWTGPPDNVLGRAVDLAAVLARTPTLAIVADAFRAYPTGVRFTLTVAFRLRERAYPDPFNSRLLLGVGMADGRRARSHLGDATAGEPVLWQLGGHGGSRRAEMDFWLHPLPPPGPMLVVVKWEDAGVDEHAVEVDAAPLVAAAAEAEELWPDDRPVEGWGWRAR